jgi:transcription termination factor NusB
MRRLARERAVQFLFQHDLNPPEDVTAALDQFWEGQRVDALPETEGPTWGQPIEVPPPSVEDVALREFADGLIRGTLEHRAEMDETIKRHCRNWGLSRLAAVDRNVLRLARTFRRSSASMKPWISQRNSQRRTAASSSTGFWIRSGRN